MLRNDISPRGNFSTLRQRTKLVKNLYKEEMKIIKKNIGQQGNDRGKQNVISTKVKKGKGKRNIS